MQTSIDLPPSFHVLIACLLLTYALSRARWRLRSRGLPLPPGPKPLPFIGNIFHMRNPEPWKAHQDLCKKYGDVVHVSIMGQRIILLGSSDAIFDLLDKRSATTSGRLQSPLIGLSGLDVHMAFMPYGQRWKQHRRAFGQQFTSKVNPKHVDILWESARVFARMLLEDPTNLRQHIRYTFSASIVKATYGMNVAEQNDPNVASMESAAKGVHAFTPGQFLVQYLPYFQYIPAWAPFVGTQMRQLSVWRTNVHQVKNALFELTRQSVERGDDAGSVVGNFVRKMEGLKGSELIEQQDIAKDIAVSVFEVAMDTTFATLQFFFLAMSLYPDVQKKAQAELDAVIGPDRLPTHEDKPFLPYLVAVMKETIRWRAIAPAGVPHMSDQDLVFRDYFIPKGTLLVPLIWACLNDPDTYPEPDRCMPERFLRDGKLDPNVRDPSDFAFGFGRRKCPGQGYAEAALFINMAIVLHVFDITPPCDEHGNPIVIEPRVTGSLILSPEVCRCTVKPRIVRGEALIYGNGFDSQ